MNFYKSKSEMKVPSRAAPPPPTGISSWSSSIFGSNSREKSSQPCTVKKKAPPRPPPPKFSGASRPQLVHGLFPKSQPRTIHEATGSLIDWSPPSSPTSTTRSSSDALSVNSFGSDTVNPSSGSTSNVESGFEDDFDLFGGAPKKVADAWNSQSSQPNRTTESWVKFSPSVPKKQMMPTIIRVKPERPKVPKILEKKIEMDALAEIFQTASTLQQQQSDEDDEGCDSYSPPMPTCPPPPPPQMLANLLEETGAVAKSADMATALFDYVGDAGDLSFRKGDRLQIVRHIDDNWVEASLRGTTGTAPTNHLQMENNSKGEFAVALYRFTPEGWEDLALEAGDRVRLLGRVSTEWVYGEVAGRRGQLPANFIDHVPADLPPWTS